MLLLSARAAAAPAGDDPGHEPWLVYVEAGADALGGTGYALAEPGLEYRGQDLHLAVGAPLRLSLVGEGGGALRREDVDERSDAGAILRRLSYGEEGEAFRLVAGSLPPLTLGHGAVLGQHRASIDPDHGRASALIVLDLGPAVLEGVATDLLAARLYAGRVAIPVGDLVGLEDRIGLAATYAVDPAAPAGPAERVTRARTVIGPTQAAQLAAAELDVVLVRTKPFALAPYVDAVGLLGSGAGLHVGTSADVRLGRGGDTVLGLRAEWRRMGEGYLPSYFDGFYEVEKLAYPTVASDPKLATARASRAGDGMAAEARLGAGEALSLGARVEGRGHGPIAAELGADLDLGSTSVAALLARRGAYTPADLLDLSGETWLLAESRTGLTESFYVFGTVAQLFHTGDDGRPAPLFEASVGVGAIAGF